MPRSTCRTSLALALLWIAAALAAPPRALDAGTSPDPKLLERARSILKAAPLIDTNNDLPYGCS
jgi:hypothetical protein